MSKVYQTWVAMSEALPTDQQRQSFYDEYYAREADVYSVLLAELADGSPYSGTEEEMAAHYGMEAPTFAAFLDGINTSLADPVDLEELEESTVVNWEIVPEKLFYNMLDARADWLYNLPQWDKLLSPEERRAILRRWRQDNQVSVEQLPGRNDPCPCGSGKKYKKCCMKKDQQAD